MTDLSNIAISTKLEDLLCYSSDASYLKGVKPAMIAWPKTTEEVLRIVRYARQNSMCIVPRGAGTAMTGSAVPTDKRAIVLSLERMRKILEINTKNMTVLVEPGLLNGTLQKELQCLNFFYPPDPSSLNYCTIGGNVATNAGGPRAIKYGVTRDYVMELEVVLADGSVLQCGGKTHKRVVGYDLKDLIVGSEGTLAIVTKIRLKILPMPEDVITLSVSFRDLNDCVEAISRILCCGVIPRTLEFLDKGCIRLLNRFNNSGFDEHIKALLLIEIDGNVLAIKKDAETVVSICNKLKGDVAIAQDNFSRQSLWETRRALSPALYHLKKVKTNEDIVVPRDKIPEIILEIESISRETSTDILCFGHAGDGNIHVNIITDSREGSEGEKIELIRRRLFEATVRCGGSISGEHGIGLTKAPYLSLEIGDRQLELMKKIKEAFDPEGLLNPHKILNS